MIPQSPIPMNIFTVIAFVSNTLFAVHVDTDVVIKSSVSKDQTRVYVNMTLPSVADVSFSLADEEGDMKHHWKAQTLSRGRHNLALQVPLLAQGKYVLLIEVGEESYQQMIYLSGR